MLIKKLPIDARVVHFQGSQPIHSCDVAATGQVRRCRNYFRDVGLKVGPNRHESSMQPQVVHGDGAIASVDILHLAQYLELLLLDVLVLLEVELGQLLEVDGQLPF